jgi:hypothetical protein
MENHDYAAVHNGSQLVGLLVSWATHGHASHGFLRVFGASKRRETLLEPADDPDSALFGRQDNARMRVERRLSVAVYAGHSGRGFVRGSSRCPHSSGRQSDRVRAVTEGNGACRGPCRGRGGEKMREKGATVCTSTVYSRRSDGKAMPTSERQLYRRGCVVPKRRTQRRVIRCPQGY